MLKKIELEDKPIIEDIRKRYGHIFASHSFNMLFVWKDIVGDELYLSNDMFSLKYTAKGKNAWMFPVGNDEEKEAFIREHLSEKNFRLCYMRNEDVQFLQKRFPGSFKYISKPEDSEYVYEVMKHIELPGKTYRNFRYRVNAAKRRYPDLRVEEINDGNIQDVKQIIMDWKPRGRDRGTLHTEGNEADIIPCDMWKELGYYGIVIYIENKPVATALGYQLNEDGCDFAIRKLCIDDRDLGYYTAWLFTLRAKEQGSIYINYEDDLDIRGLREFKQGLHPDHMNNVTEAHKI